MKTKNSLTHKGPLPLVLGITGHIDLRDEDLPVIKAAVGGLFAELQQKFPHSPIRLLSPLAEGADRLVAELALKCGFELIVPLPLPEDLYRDDFRDPKSLAEFNSLKARASAVYELSTVRQAEMGDISQDPQARKACYEQVGVYIAHHAHLLLALWTGQGSEKQGSEKQGGTAQIVGYRLKGEPVEGLAGDRLLDAHEPGAVWHLPVGRSKDEPLAAGLVLGKGRWLMSVKDLDAGQSDADFSIWPKLPNMAAAEAFNCAARGLHITEDMIQGMQALLPDTDRHSQKETCNPALSMVRTMAAADQLAGRHQQQTYRVWRRIFLLAGLMVLSFEGYAHLWPHAPLLAVYPLAFLAMSVIWLRHARRRAYNGFLEARALAEGLRVQVSWRRAGLSQSAADQYLRRHATGLGWVIAALRGLNTLPPAQFSLEYLHRVKKDWVQNQAGYFKKRSRSQEHRLRRHEQLAFGFYGSALVLSVGMLISSFFWELHGLPHHILIVLIGLGPAIAALWLAYAEKQGWEEHVKEYSRMGALFVRAEEQLNELLEKAESSSHGSEEITASLSQAKDLLLGLGKEALYENAEWLTLHRQRPPSIPLG